MSVHYQPGCSKPRPVLVGDPAGLPIYHGPGTRKRNPNYAANKAARAQQTSPAKRSTPRRPGPTHRAPGIQRKDWVALMGG